MRRPLVRWGAVLTAVVLACGIALAVLWLAPSGDYLLLPDKPHALDPLVTVSGQKKPPRDGGGIYFVDALVRKASLLESCSWTPRFLGHLCRSITLGGGKALIP